jgi:signal peptidase I
MKGTLHAGDFLSIQINEVKNIRRGDIVVYRSHPDQKSSKIISHRVIKILPTGLITQGDNSPYPDKRVITAENYLGTVISFIRNGSSKPLTGGLRGYLQGIILHTLYRMHEYYKNLLLIPFHWLRSTRIIPLIWKPKLIRLRLNTAQGPLIKYLRGEKTIARWWVEKNFWECRTPYSLLDLKRDLLQ